MNEILEKDEKVLWEGKPNTGSYFTKMIIPSIFGMIFFTIFITFVVSFATVFITAFKDAQKTFETIETIAVDENFSQIETINENEEATNELIVETIQEVKDFNPLDHPFYIISNNYKTVITYVSIFVGAMFIISLVVRIIEFNNLKYFVTDKRVIIQRGIIGKEYRVIEYTKIDDLYVKIGLINKIFNTGTVILLVEYMYAGSGDSQPRSYQKVDISNSFVAIKKPYDVFNKIKEVSQDIRTDIYYPNGLRPEENEGYDTKYNPEDKK